jgi:Co/Zn/Cd efflux system component
MDDCCEVHEVPRAQRSVLTKVLWINVAMFVAEAVAGVLAHSTSLLADSGDMLGDAIVYGFSLWVVGRSDRWKARAALLKGLVMGAVCLGVLVQVAIKLVSGLASEPGTMGIVGGTALVANGVCLALLSPHRSDDVNMRSAWICSRNDVIGNAGVLLAAAGVALTGSSWPDIVTGVLIAGVYGLSSVAVVRSALRARGDA